jgi:hypothetical protein
MASTRNKNTPGNYALEIEGKREQAVYKMNEIYSAPVETAYCGDGLLSGSIGPAKLATNYCDIESQLRGIGANNLVAPLPQVTPELNNLRSLSIIDRIPVIVPKSYVHNNEERPFRGLTN